MEKHGTCSFPVVRDEYEYFFATLNLYFKYNVTKVLSEAGYVPSNTEKYPLGGVISAIQNAFHATPSLSCSNGAVEELQICFYKDFKPRDCLIGSTTRTDVLSSASCPKYVSLPEYVSPVFTSSLRIILSKTKIIFIKSCPILSSVQFGLSLFPYLQVLKMVMPHSHGYLSMKLSETAAGLHSISWPNDTQEGNGNDVKMNNVLLKISR
ncbi:hypothetical protein RHGRI_002649 [Rhododendron griersonianum]|uniref:Uncharacterized protein n=1 Tax=Rhododendron griersonianum TaxID=479676 RepID=A0AAV6LPP4_9ERIC|nr:hypothetical protein RHGRI_002649 [Rhododendron griersonianum]